MRGWLWLFLSAPLVVAPRRAAAQGEVGQDAACGEVLNVAVAPDCVGIAQGVKKVEELEVKERELRQQLAALPTTPPPTTPAPTPTAPTAPTTAEALKKAVDDVRLQIKTETARIDALRDTPLEKLDGFCGSVEPSTPRTCEELATRLGAFDDESVKRITEATKNEAAETDGALARHAAASDRRTSNNKSGSSAQLDPVESLQPITVAGGALTLSGTRTGSKGVGTISVNPIALAAPNDVAYGRLFDLTVSAPFDLEGSGSNNDPYISARARINVTGPVNAAELESKVDAWLAASGVYADDLAGVLSNAKDVKVCANYIAQHGKAAVSACEQDLESAPVRKLRKEAYAEMARARRAADQCYLGFDLRFDTGDPTGPDIIGDRGEHALGGIAAGVRIATGKLWDWELRGRVAYDLFKSRDPFAGQNPELVHSFDWGGAVLFSGRMQEAAKQRMAFGIGMEGRHAGSDSENAKLSPTNYWNLNFMAVVPAVTGGDLGLAIGVPLVEGREPRGVLVSFSTDLGLLDHSP
jgi:hypothetical protein